ncbi:dipeptide ABC transporter ATP-binding protein [Arenivirga flava]|uniref:Peptide ABC transporter ATP-binding protein n=1 Tax=Arenivirga flava TaxID=1930060 RepID=A0AA37XAW4_9MICO|nr:ABC transporter ATP-binding protein [Arenivirga flava]GMA27781.1 peptide ABC transporter ATP-binding protein [Arenivirga flava]
MTIALDRPTAATRTAVLETTGLRIGYTGRDRTRRTVVQGADLRLEAGRTLALVGQSGSGKSTIAAALAGLLPANGTVESGAIRLDGVDATALDERGWRALRGGVVGTVPQDPLSSLDPLERIGTRLVRTLALHAGLPRAARRVRAVELLRAVGIRDAEERLRAFPHELSGGQLQRVLIALAIAGRPRLLIADEPTSALDVTVQRTILDLIRSLQEQLGLAVLLITHDLALAAERADEVAVLHDGRIVDQGPARRVLEQPEDAYTSTLFATAPALSPDRYGDRERARSAEDVVVVRDLVKRFGRGAPAVDRVSLTVTRGEVHALVGESGSGKTTVARAVAGLTAFEGSIAVEGTALAADPPRSNPHPRLLQLVSQNPLAALDPRFTVRRAVEEPLRVHGGGNRAQRRERAEAVLDEVALPDSLRERRPHELSGGQRQRVAIARALALAPRVLLLDEPTSALDVVVQAQIIDLLMGLRERECLSYLVITHDLSLVRQIADRVTVLEHGRVVESGPVRGLFAAPAEEYTRRLIAAIPRGLG